MAKAGISLEFRPYQRRDPVSGAKKVFVRDKHSRQSAERLKRFQACVRERMMGSRHAGATPRERAAAVRAAFSAAAKACSAAV